MPKTYTLADFTIAGKPATREIIWDDPDGWHEVQERTAGDKRRWCTMYNRVIRKNPDEHGEINEWVDITWEEGNTEYQEDSDEIGFDAVEPTQKIITIYTLVRD